MTISERERIALVHALEESLGPGAAATIMEYLPATGWREVATRSDLDELRSSLRAEMAEGFARQTATLMVAQLGSTSLLVALAAFFLR